MCSVTHMYIGTKYQYILRGTDCLFNKHELNQDVFVMEKKPYNDNPWKLPNNLEV